MPESITIAECNGIACPRSVFTGHLAAVRIGEGRGAHAIGHPGQATAGVVVKHDLRVVGIALRAEAADSVVNVCRGAVLRRRPLRFDSTIGIVGQLEDGGGTVVELVGEPSELIVLKGSLLQFAIHQVGQIARTIIFVLC